MIEVMLLGGWRGVEGHASNLVLKANAGNVGYHQLKPARLRQYATGRLWTPEAGIKPGRQPLSSVTNLGGAQPSETYSGMNRTGERGERSAPRHRTAEGLTKHVATPRPCGLRDTDDASSWLSNREWGFIPTGLVTPSQSASERGCTLRQSFGSTSEACVAHFHREY